MNDKNIRSGQIKIENRVLRNKDLNIMIIYIPLEIFVRELYGHLVFAITAASRGHQVFIATPNDIWLYKRMGFLPKGCYLLKNMNIPSSSEKVYSDFLNSGFDLYCHEQEPSILWDQFDKFLQDYNISKNQNLPFKGVFCWGERDTNSYKSFFGNRSEIFFNTGSPRADLWNKRFLSLYKNKEQIVHEKYILVVSNFSWLMGHRHLSEWMLKHRSLELIESFQSEQNLIHFLEEDFTIAFRMILAIKHLSKKHKSLKFLIRPHPLDEVNYWRNIFINNENVIITGNKGPITPFIVGAHAVIQNGCTSSVEATLFKVPVISYGPERTQSDLAVPNRLGFRAKSIEELEIIIEKIINGQNEEKVQLESEQILKPLLSTQNGNAALEMIRIMEERSQFDAEIKLTNKDILKLRLVRTIKDMIDLLRRTCLRKNLESSGFTLNQLEINNNIRLMCEIVDLESPKITFIFKTGLLIE